MNAEDHIEQARIRRDQPDKVQLRRARIIGLLLASATIISLTFLVFAFIQKGEAEKTRQELFQVKQELENCQRIK
jgi:hypothetical protein